MNEQKPVGIERLVKATKYSWQGLNTAFRYEAAFRQETLIALALIPAGLWLGETGMQKALLISSVIIVLIVELINSGIEYVVDRFGGEIHEYSGAAKDVGSAAVFLSLVNVCTIWALVLFF